MELCSVGFSGFSPLPGATCTIGDDGRICFEITFRGERGNLGSLLSQYPVGSSLPSGYDFGGLERSIQTKKKYGCGTVDVTLKWTGSDIVATTDPDKCTVRKCRTARAANLNSGEAGVNLLGDADDAAGEGIYDVKYFTIDSTVEYCTATEQDKPTKKTKAGVNGNLNQLIQIYDTAPALPLEDNQYYGGEYCPPDNDTAVLNEGEHYQLDAIPTNFCSTYDDELGVWCNTESWTVYLRALVPATP